MAVTHGKDACLKLDDDGGTLRDVSAAINSVDFNEVVELAEDTAFGDSAKSFIVGLRDATFSVSGLWDDAATTGSYTVIASLIDGYTGTFEYGPEGGSSGDIKYTGECICTSFNTSSPVGDIVTFKADFQVTGAVSRSTFA